MGLSRRPLFEEPASRFADRLAGPDQNLDQLETVVAEKGFEWGHLCQKLREKGSRRVINHWVFYPLDAARNARIDDETYHRRSFAKALFLAPRKRFISTPRDRTWFGQFQEVVLEVAVRNIELGIGHSTP